MKTIIIAEGIRLTATATVIETYKREVREERAYREAVEWLRTHDASDELYSDIYKDVYGVRPRWLYA